MSQKITQALILAGGLGTRLRPLTDTVPKVMVEIAPGKPLLQHEIEQLRDQGITDIILSVNYLADVIRAHFGDGARYGVHIRCVSDGDLLLETGGALKHAGPLLDENFVFIYGDHLQFFDFTPVIAVHLERGALATIVLKTSDDPAHGEILEFDPVTKKITACYVRPHTITEFTETRMVNSGLYVLSKKIIDYIPSGQPVKLDGEIIPKVIAAGGSLYAFPTHEKILDIGMPEKYERAKQYYQDVVKSKL